MAHVTRGFQSRRTGERRPDLPPGQYDAGDSWPILTAEPTPSISTDDWTFTVDGLVRHPRTWSWQQIHELPQDNVERNIHCVTGWSKFEMTFGGVSVDTLVKECSPLPTATHALAISHTGYTTNLTVDDLIDDRAFVVWEANGAPLTPSHGGPARLLVPHLYFWKSAKWIAGIRLLDHNESGFWEQRGYHDRGDPWIEQRYRGDR